MQRKREGVIKPTEITVIVIGSLGEDGELFSVIAGPDETLPTPHEGEIEVTARPDHAGESASVKLNLPTNRKWTLWLSRPRGTQAGRPRPRYKLADLTELHESRTIDLRQRFATQVLASYTAFDQRAAFDPEVPDWVQIEEQRFKLALRKTGGVPKSLLSFFRPAPTHQCFPPEEEWTEFEMEFHGPFGGANPPPYFELCWREGCDITVSVRLTPPTSFGVSKKHKIRKVTSHHKPLRFDLKDDATTVRLFFQLDHDEIVGGEMNHVSETLPARRIGPSNPVYPHLPCDLHTTPGTASAAPQFVATYRNIPGWALTAVTEKRTPHDRGPFGSTHNDPTAFPPLTGGRVDKIIVMNVPMNVRLTLPVRCWLREGDAQPKLEVRAFLGTSETEFDSSSVRHPGPDGVLSDYWALDLPEAPTGNAGWGFGTTFGSIDLYLNGGNWWQIEVKWTNVPSWQDFTISSPWIKSVRTDFPVNSDQSFEEIEFRVGGG